MDSLPTMDFIPKGGKKGDKKGKKGDKKGKKGDKTDFVKRIAELHSQYPECKLFDKILERIATELVMFQDGSGSMANFPDILNSMKGNLEEAVKLYGEILVWIFGEHAIIDSRNGAKGFLTIRELLKPGFFGIDHRLNVKQHALISNCNQTSAESLPHGFETLCGSETSSKKKHVICSMDGGFNDGKSISIADGVRQFKEILAKIKEAGNLNKVASITVFFPTSVNESTVKSITESMSAILKTVQDRFIDLRIAEIPKAGDYTVLSKCISSLPTYVYCIPEGFEGVGEVDVGDVYWTKGAQPAHVAKLLKSSPQGQAKVNFLIKKMLELVKKDPQILENGIYAKIHAILRELKSFSLGITPCTTSSVAAAGGASVVDTTSSTTEQTVQIQYLDVIATEKSKAIPGTIQWAALDTLMKDSWSFQDPFENELLEILSENFMRFEIPDDKQKTAIRDRCVIATKDQRGEEMAKLIHDVFDKFEMICDNTCTTGMPIPIPARCIAATFSYRKACMMAFEQFFSCVGSTGTISGKRLFALVLLILTSPTLEVMSIITTMAETIILNRDYVKNMLGLKKQVQSDGSVKKVVEVDPSWYDPLNAKLLYHFLTLYNDELLRDDEELTQLAEYFKKIHVITTEKNALTCIVNTPRKIWRELPCVSGKKISGIDTGSLVFIPVWKEDPNPGLPSVGVVLKIIKKHGMVFAKILYLDEPSTVEQLQYANAHVGKHAYRDPRKPDTVVLNVSELTLKGISCKELDDEIFRYLIHTKYGTGEGQDGGRRNENLTVREQREKHICDLIATFSGGVVSQRFVNTEIIIPKGIVTSVMLAFFPTMKNITAMSPIDNKLEQKHIHALIPTHIPIVDTLRGSFSSTTSVAAASGEVVSTIPTTYMHQTIQIILTPTELDDLRSSFVKLVLPEPGKPTQNVVECSCCFEPKGRLRRVHMQCGHAMCLSCSKQSVDNVRASLADKTSGIIPLNLCRCPICRQGSILKKGEFPFLDKFLETRKEEFHGLYRSCSTCKDVFMAGTTDCAGAIGEMPFDCDKCRKPVSFNCPSCERPYQHAGGCRLMRCCPLGYHGCPNDNGEECTHMGYGCGHIWEITPEEQAVGTGDAAAAAADYEDDEAAAAADYEDEDDDVDEDDDEDEFDW
jgi:hypothetical protein